MISDPVPRYRSLCANQRSNYPEFQKRPFLSTSVETRLIPAPSISLISKARSGIRLQLLLGPPSRLPLSEITTEGKDAARESGRMFAKAFERLWYRKRGTWALIPRGSTGRDRFERKKVRTRPAAGPTLILILIHRVSMPTNDKRTEGIPVVAKGTWRACFSDEDLVPRELRTPWKSNLDHSFFSIRDVYFGAQGRLEGVSRLQLGRATSATRNFLEFEVTRHRGNRLPRAAIFRE